MSPDPPSQANGKTYPAFVCPPSLPDSNAALGKLSQTSRTNCLQPLAGATLALRVSENQGKPAPRADPPSLQ